MTPRPFDQELGSTLTCMAAAMRRGASLEVALSSCGELAAPEVRAETRRILGDIGAGGGRARAFRGLVERRPDGNTELLAAAVDVAERSGGDLGGILDTVAATIRERTMLDGELRTKTAHARFSGLIVGLIPVALIVALSIAAPDYLRPALASQKGRLLLAGSVVLAFIGIGVIQIMLRIRPRGGVRQGMANTFDVLIVSLEAGWSFDQAAAAVAASMTTPLALELRSVLAEIAGGRPRAEALAALAQRTGSEEIAAFTRMLAMSDQTGAPLGATLRLHSAELRRLERQRMQTRINRAPVLMMLPLAGCVLPAVLLALMTPTILRVLGALLTPL